MQKVCLKLGKSYSQYITICNGVRQGEILFPELFSLYVNHLTEKLISCHVGCHFNGICINHVMYADDTCLVAPTASAMQHLLMYVMIMVWNLMFYLIPLNQSAGYLNLILTISIFKLFYWF